VKRPTIQDLPCFQPSCRLRVALICRGLIALFVIGGVHAGAAADDMALLRELRSETVLLMRHTETTAGVGAPPAPRMAPRAL
jgi:hypothetical protein